MKKNTHILFKLLCFSGNSNNARYTAPVGWLSCTFKEKVKIYPTKKYLTTN